MIIIGIDLGTTNSLAAYWNGSKAELIPNVFGEYLTPSVVSIDENEEIIVGKRAKERLVTHPHLTVAGFKRFMGTDKTWELGSRIYGPDELSALVLKQLRADAETYLGEAVEEAIISVPAYFNDNSRFAVKNAGILAGLKVERLINEPSAAALAHGGGQETGDIMKYMVFDFGGGTLDISMVEQFDNITEIVAVAGDNMLGGQDFDTEIAEYFYQQTGLKKAELTEYNQASIIRIAEQCKKELSVMNEITMQAVVNDEIYSCTITNSNLIIIGGDLFYRIKNVIKKALADSGFTFESPINGMEKLENQIDEIIVVGGSGKMPVVQQYLQHLTKRALYTDLHPDHAIAVGVAVAAGIKMRQGDVKDIVLCDICPFTLGIDIIGSGTRKLMSPLIERNAVLPCSKQGVYQAIHVNQEYVDIYILQGESRWADENLEIGFLKIKLPQNNQQEVFIVTFAYDINGILNLNVKLLSNGQDYERVILNQKLKMTPEEIEKKVTELKNITLANREDAVYLAVMERGARLYRETTGAVRVAVAQHMEYLENSKASDNLLTIRKACKKVDKFLAMIEVKQMFLPGELEEMLEDQGEIEEE